MISTIHDRMPVILHPEDYTRRLSRSGARPAHLLKPFPSDLLTMWPRSSLPICFPWNDLAVGASKLSGGDSIAMRGEVRCSMTMAALPSGCMITACRSREHLSLVAKKRVEPGRHKPLYDKPD
jgi:hypothetical protein